MKVIKSVTVHQWAQKHATAASSLLGWLELVKAAKFKDFAALKQVYRTADLIRVASGRKVVVFNISGNNYRLIAAVHFNTQRVFALRFMTHAEYSKDSGRTLYEKSSQPSSFYRFSQRLSPTLRPLPAPPHPRQGGT